MKTTDPVSFGSALDLLETVDIGELIVLTVVHKSKGSQPNVAEHIGRLAGTSESQTTHGSIAESSFPVAPEIDRTVVILDRTSVSIDWDDSIVSAWVQAIATNRRS